ncbi:hypothetical protein TRVL_04823 [Trypanosoma vivax]|nr:hypothetical protein TRVL_04823 [Trypanosoma vivax]
MFSRGRGDPGRGRMENAPGDRVMIRVGDETVSVTLIEENPGLERARKVGRGRWCKKDNEHDISRCSFLHKKGAVPTDRRDLGAAVDAVLELAFSDDPVADILSNEEIRAGFSSTIQQSGANARLLKIVHRIMEIDEAEDTSTEVRDLQLLCDTWIIRCSSDMGKLQTWNGETQRQLFALVYGACKKDPFSPDNREALRTTADLPGVPDVSRREAEQFLLDTEREAAEANVADGENEVGNTRRFVVSPMYGDDIASLAETSAKPQTATELCMGSMRLEDLPRLVVDRFIPHQLRGLHIRALFHLSRADCTHALGLAIKLAEERGPESLLRRNADGSGLRIYATTMTFSGILAHPSHGVVGNMIPHGRRHSAKSKFMPGDLVVMWPSSEGNQYTEPAIGIVKRILDDGGVHISFVDILHALPVVSGGVSLVVARCPTFYLPTEASLLTLRKREYDIANNKEPPLLCACLTGVGSTDPPLYLQGNPRILLGPFVALARPSTDEQYVLDTWNGERWSVALEGSTTEESGGTKALLDGTQLGALQHMFRNRVAIVQGTPGTGKSFTSTKFLQILLRNKKRLRIGPIIIMTYTHHALEASLKSLLQLVDRSDHRIGVFAPRDESLMQYGIRLHSSPLDTEGLTSVLKDFMSIVKATRINPDLEKQILAVMQKHGPHMRCTAYTRTRHNEMVSVLGKPTQDYWSSAEEVRNRVVAETGWRPPRTLHDLEAVAAALRRNEWIDVVDLVPHLTKICGDRGAQFENAVQEEKKREKKGGRRALSRGRRG